jgi:hypothetical protein
MVRFSKKKVIKKKSVNKNKNKNTRVKKRRISRGKSRRRVKRKYGGGTDKQPKKVENVKLNTKPETVLLAMFILALLRIDKSTLTNDLFSNKHNDLVTALQDGGGDRPEISEPIVDEGLLRQLQTEYNLRSRNTTPDELTASLLRQFTTQASNNGSTQVTHIWREINPDDNDDLLKYSTEELNKSGLDHSRLNVKIAIDLAVAAKTSLASTILTKDQIKELFGDIDVEETPL